MNIAYVPARSGSRRLPNKNFKTFSNLQSLTEVSLKQANLIDHIDLVILDTDSSEFLLYAKNNNLADLYIERPPSLASSFSTTSESLIHCISQVESSQRVTISTITVLQPTSPVRTLTTINKMYNHFISNGYPLVASATDLPLPLNDFFMHQHDNYLVNIPIPSTDRPIYFLNGSVYILTRNHLFDSEAPFIPQTFDQIFLTPIEQFVDIDTTAHFDLAKLLFRSNTFS